MEKALEGDLACFEVPDLLTFLHQGERSGVLSMERPDQETKLYLRAGKAMFGLMNTTKLFLLQGSGTAAFPAGSLEAYLLEAAVMETEVKDVLKGFIGEEVSNPPQRALGLMKRGMSERGMLEAEMKKSMIFFATIDYVLPASTRMAAEAESLEPVQQLLRDFEQREPELALAAQKDIDAARVSMTSSSD